MNEKRRKYHRDWYQANKEQIRPRKQENSKNRRDFLRFICDEIKLILGCKNCGYDSHPKALQFHHRESEKKSFDISDGVSHIGILRLLKELTKCDVLCANCHSIFTHSRRGA